MNQLSQTSNPAGRISALDGFRGLAVLLVTFYRFGEVSLTAEVVGSGVSKAVLLGGIGVDFFFVLSGFLITGILLDTKTNENYFRRFYWNRTLRIFPLYFASLLLMLIILPRVFAWSVIPDNIQQSTFYLWTYTTNLIVAWEDAWQFGYLDHFWSLAIEEQFYLVWPLVVFSLDRKKLLWLCIVGCIAVPCLRVGMSIGEIGEATEKTFTLFRVDGLLLGALAAMMTRSSIDLSANSKLIRNGLIASSLVFIASLAMGSNDYTIRYTLVSLVAGCLLLQLLVAPKQAITRRLLENPILRSFGKYSYAMYVFQYPLVALLAPWIAPTIIKEWVGQPLLAAILYVVLMFVATYLIAVVSWFSCERWFLQLKSGSHQPSSSLKAEVLASP